MTIQNRINQIKSTGEQIDRLLAERQTLQKELFALENAGSSPEANEMFLRLLPGRIKQSKKRLAETQEQIDFNIAYCEMEVEAIKAELVDY